MAEERGTASIVVAAAILAMMAVAAGAFGAHLVEAADPRAARLLETGSRYQLVHAVAILSILAIRPAARLAIGTLLLGTVLFPLSLYALAAGAPLQVASLAPVGGLALLAGWGLVAAAAFSAPRQPPENEPAPPFPQPGRGSDRC